MHACIMYMKRNKIERKINMHDMIKLYSLVNFFNMHAYIYILINITVQGNRQREQWIQLQRFGGKQQG